MVVNNALAATNNAADLGGAFSPERLSYAGQMTLLGMLMVFAVLAILWGILALFKVFFVKEAKAPKKQSADAPAPAVVPSAPEVPAQEQSDDELIAVLTAAVAAYIESEGLSESYSGGFRVVSFRRAGTGRSWNAK